MLPLAVLSAIALTALCSSLHDVLSVYLLSHQFLFESRARLTDNKMKSIASLAAFAGGVASQVAFEPTEFNVTAALLNNGVAVSALPDLTSTVGRTSVNGCSAAVGAVNRIFLTMFAELLPVHVSQAHLWSRESCEP